MFLKCSKNKNKKHKEAALKTHYVALHQQKICKKVLQGDKLRVSEVSHMFSTFILTKPDRQLGGVGCTVVQPIVRAYLASSKTKQKTEGHSFSFACKIVFPPCSRVLVFSKVSSMKPLWEILLAGKTIKKMLMKVVLKLWENILLKNPRNICSF